MSAILRGIMCIVGLALIVTITSCGSWKHDYKPRSALRDDLNECQRDVRSFRRGYTGEEDPFREQTLINDCMRNKGWYR